jgi:ketosteroid isomerase-like protein
MNTMDAAPPWLGDLMQAIDARDAAAFARFLTPDVAFRFGNAPVTRGRPAVEAAVAGFFQAIGGCRHRLSRVWRDGDALAMQGEVTYTRLDGGEVTVPFVNVFTLRDALVAEYLIYIDNGPLFAPA